MAIGSFKCRDTEAVFNRVGALRFQSIEKVALRKLIQLDSAAKLADLGLPGNRLEPLKGDRIGQHSIRINDQYRLCFVWQRGEAYDVEIDDYH